jgi:hypothetical protein
MSDDTIRYNGTGVDPRSLLDELSRLTPQTCAEVASAFEHAAVRLHEMSLVFAVKKRKEAAHEFKSRESVYRAVAMKLRSVSRDHRPP